jgi:hypothetical protein
MADKYLQIALTGDKTGAVVNMVMMEDSDFFDPAYEWTKVSPDSPTPGIGHNIVLAPVTITTGDKTTFTPYHFSDVSGGFLVSFDGINVNIDCQSYEMRWIRSELTNLCKNEAVKGSLGYAGKIGILYQDYCIAWDDANALLAILETLVA